MYDAWIKAIDCITMTVRKTETKPVNPKQWA
jgi:hypothetical protein